MVNNQWSTVIVNYQQSLSIINIKNPTMQFSQTFFQILILSALVLMSIGAIALITMLISDIKTKKLW